LIFTIVGLNPTIMMLANLVAFKIIVLVPRSIGKSTSSKKNPRLNSSIHGSSSTPSVKLVKTFHPNKSLCLPLTMRLSRLKT
jgi:hypothetical protein